jgi:hypothetical protein
MRVRLLAPFRYHFDLLHRTVLSDERAYCTFWERAGRAIHNRLGDYPHLESALFLHSRYEEAALRYERIHQNGTSLSPEIFRLTPSAKFGPHLARAAAEADALLPTDVRGFLTPLPQTLLFRGFDNTVAQAEILVEADARHLGAQAENACRLLQDWSNCLLREVVKRFYASTLFPLLLDLWQADPRGEFLEPPGQFKAFPDVTLTRPLKRGERGEGAYDPAVAGKPLWVNRSLYWSEGSGVPPLDKVAAHWLSPTACGEFRAARASSDEAIYLGWGHNILCAPADSTLATDAWEALLLGQYYYSVLETTNLGLNRFIGLTLGEMSRKETARLNALMQDVVSSVNLVVTQFIDTQQNLQGNRQGFFKDLKHRWNMDALVHNIEKKIGMVSQQVSRIHEKWVKSSQFFIELILFAIGSIGLLEFTVALTQFSRTEVSPPDKGPAADGVPGLLDLAAALPPDGVLWGGISVLAVLALFFILFQRQRSH